MVESDRDKIINMENVKWKMENVKSINLNRIINMENGKLVSAKANWLLQKTNDFRVTINY